MTFALDAGDLASQVTPIIGREVTAEELLTIGERIWNLEKFFNLKAGISPKEDTLPPRLLKEPIPAGPSKGRVNKLHEMLPRYYELRGWDKDGTPTKEKLESLDLLDLATK